MTKIEGAFAPFVARLLTSQLFIIMSLYRTLAKHPTFISLREEGLNKGAEIYLWVAIAFEFIAAMMLLLGWKTPIACYLLIIFLLPITFVEHGFWNFPNNFETQLLQFLKNIVILGNLVFLAAMGPGRWSLDYLASHKNQE